MNNLYILTEERPKENVLKFIIKRFLQDKAFSAFINELKIVPVLQDDKFSFYYEILGVECKAFAKIYLKIISGESSFVDYLVFFQKTQPNNDDVPLYAIEATKTDDSESRNTGVYQRITKFVYLEYFYPNTTKIMLYNLYIPQKQKPTQTAIFGTKILRTLGVELAGKSFDEEILKPFKSIEELIQFKANMKKAPKGNVPIMIYKLKDKIQISARLIKSNMLAHDPSIGAISGIAATLRKLNYTQEIQIIAHALSQNHLTANNKFIKIANLLNISLEKLRLPQAFIGKDYWHYEKKSEKLATIFIHLVVEYFTNARMIFENHAGCEKGYFFTSTGEVIALQKYEDRKAYKAGDKNARLCIPDLILLDMQNLEIINIEGKKYTYKNQGIAELKNYNFIEKAYIKKYYPRYKIIRTVVLFGSNVEKIVEVEVGFLLNENGKLILGIKAPKLFIFALQNLLDFWRIL